MPWNFGISRRDAVKLGGALVLLSSLDSAAASSDEEDEDEEPYTGAEVRAAHLSPDAPEVDIYVNGIAIVRDVAFKTISDYFRAVPDEYRIRVVPAGEDPEDAVIDEDVEVPEGEFSVAAIGELADKNQPLEPLVLEDDNSEVDEDTARLRAVHAAPDAPSVDIVADGDALFEDVAYGESGYIEVPAGDYTVSIYPAGDRDEAVFELDASLEEETVYTAWAVGYLDPDAAPIEESFDIVVSVDSAPEDEEDEEEDDEDEE